MDRNDFTSFEAQLLMVVQTLGRLEGKIDANMEAEKNLIKIVDDHEGRLRNMEKASWKQLGFVGGIAAAVSFLAQYMFKAGVFPQ